MVSHCVFRYLRFTSDFLGSNHQMREPACPRWVADCVQVGEEAHLRWRHADLVRGAGLAPLVMPRWGLVRDWDAEIGLLLELVADDAASRVSGLGSMAAALRSMAGLRDDELLRMRAERIEARLARHARAPGAQAHADVAEG